MERTGKSVEYREVGSDPSRQGYFWAGESLPFSESCKHFVTVGATGSGKSITLNLLLQSVVTKMVPGNQELIRAVVYDAKADLRSLIAGMNPQVPVLLMNPMDKRFTPWDVAADIRSETDAYEFASILIPRNEKESTPYFNDTARSLVTGVIKRFIAGGGAWTLRDLVLAFETLARLKAVLTHDETRYLLDHFAEGNKKNLAGVKSTVDNTLALYRPLAALFHSAVNPAVSLRDWIQDGNSVLVLGNHEEAREATDTLNRLIFHQLSKLLISRDGEIKGDETWIFLDEVREAGRLSGLRQLLLRGRSKGVAVALGFQDIKGIYSAYGEHEGAEIVGAAQNVVILHINPSAPDTAQWASSIFGSRRDIVRGAGVSIGENFSQSTNEHAELIPNVLPIQLMQLHMPSPALGVSFYAFTNKGGHFRTTYKWPYLERFGPINLNSPDVDDFQLQMDPQHFRLKAWGQSDLKRLKLSDAVLEQPGGPSAPQVGGASMVNLPHAGNQPNVH